MLQIPNHSHCTICSKAITFGDKTCSTTCQAQLDDLDKRRKRTMFMLYGMMAVLIGITILGSQGLF